MKRIKNLALWFVMSCLFILPILPASTLKAADILPTASDNLDVGLRSYSELTAVEGGYMRVFYDGERIGIEYYDNDFTILSKKSLAMELSLWGGFYAGSDAYYLVEGQINTDESDTAEVIRVIKYDTNWTKIGVAVITSNVDFSGAGKVGVPFSTGCVEMTEHNGTLYIVTGHQGYVDPTYNQGHQGFLMIAVDEEAMTGSIVAGDAMHSFAQYIAYKDSFLYVLEQSEGSRCTQLSQYDTKDLGKISVPKTSFPVLEYGGIPTSAWAIACYASVDGMALSSDHVLCLGTSIDQSQYDNVSSDTAHNIYLTVTPISDLSQKATVVKWLTDYSGDGKSFLGAKITKINDNRFLISWEEFGTSQPASMDDGLSTSILHYIFIDGAGNIVSKEFTETAAISDCQPILKDSNIVYSASNANMVNFYSIDATTGAFRKKVYRVAGENATWTCDNGVLTIAGSGAISIDTEARCRHPLSSTLGWVSYSSTDNVWKPIRNAVTKIVIKSGITAIPEHAFEYFHNLTEVEIEPGLNRIGKEAFHSCDSLSKITIPSSVVSLGEDFLWTGYYSAFDESHLVKATIYAPEDSYAITYAKNHNIKYKFPGETGDRADDNKKENPANNKDVIASRNLSQAEIGGINKTYVYNGKHQCPNVTVTLYGNTLEQNTDYVVSYRNNINTGKAAIKIKGINNYNGLLQKTFIIIPKKAVLSKLTSAKTRRVKVTWKKDSQADGYQIQYAGNAKFTVGKKNVTISKKGVPSHMISKLKKGRKYYVCIRAYKKIDGKKWYGAWSKVKKVKCR